MICVLCLKDTPEEELCESCRTFIEWKYGSLEAFEARRCQE